ncbi:3-phosphoshikimate 1-carboxyvinyltransferase [bacterium]|nr:3-phosphoshikimate 1-carboxyvinyltransferase [bacterium]
MDAIISPSNGFQLDTQLPGDKSISHRAALIAALAEGESTITNYSNGRDCLSTLNCLKQLGIKIETSQNELKISGKGLKGFQAPSEPLDCGNSGTTARLLAGVLAGQNFDSILTGDESLSGRPMQRIIDPLCLMGADIRGTSSGTLPLTIRGKKLKSIEFSMPVASAQVKSCLLLAGLLAEGKTIIREAIPTRDHTERMLHNVTIEHHETFADISIRGGVPIAPKNISIPADLSSAAFFIVAGLLTSNSDICLRNVTLNPTRTAFLDVLESAGALISIENKSEMHSEPVGDIRIISQTRHFKPLQLSGNIIPRIIDEIPILAIFGTRAGIEIKDAKELRYKETDRIHAIVTNLRAMKLRVDEFDDGFKVFPSMLHGASIDSYGDHRIAMSFAVAGSIADGTTMINNSECVNISFPNFFNYFQSSVAMSLQ